MSQAAAPLIKKNSNSASENKTAQDFLNKLMEDLNEQINDMSTIFNYSYESKMHVSKRVHFKALDEEAQADLLKAAIQNRFQIDYGKKFENSEKLGEFFSNLGKKVKEIYSEVKKDNKKSNPRIFSKENGKKLLWGITAAAVLGFVGMALFGKSPEIIGTIIANSTALINKVADACSISLTKKQLCGIVAGALTLVGLGFIVNTKRRKFKDYKSNYVELNSNGDDSSDDDLEDKSNRFIDHIPVNFNQPIVRFTKVIDEPIEEIELPEDKIFNAFKEAAEELELLKDDSIEEEVEGEIVITDRTSENSLNDLKEIFKDIVKAMDQHHQAGHTK